MDLARDNLERVGAKEGDEIDRVKWKILLRCGDPKYGEAERRRRSCFNNIDLKKKVLEAHYHQQSLCSVIVHINNKACKF